MKREEEEAVAASDEASVESTTPVIQITDQERQTLLEKTEAARVAAVAAETERRAAEELKVQLTREKTKWEETNEAMKRALEAER